MKNVACAVFATVLLAGCASGIRETAHSTIAEGFISAEDGTRLHFRKTGNGPVNVIVPLDIMTYELGRQLADVATVVTYDPRDRGRSDTAKDPSHRSVQQDVSDLETVRAHFGFERFVPIGFSYLGKAVALYAIAHPDRVTRIVQISPSPIRDEGDGEPVDADKLGAPPADVASMRAMRNTDAKEKTPREYCLSEWRVTRYMLVGDPANAHRVDIDAICSSPNEWPVNFENNVAAVWTSVDATVPSEAELQRITVPVLTIHGTKDRNAPYSGARKWAAALPDARLLTVDGAGHYVWADAPDVVISAIREFISGRWPKASEKITPK